MKTVIFLTLVLAVLVCGDDRVQLQDVTAITLVQGKMTTGHRSSPIPQLKCVGGTAGCHTFQPKVVQCINRGFDGNDVQWECKTEMDSTYRFGQIQVSCEGYDYPNDPYVLVGSCGLEYELDLTKVDYMYSQEQRGIGVFWIVVGLLILCCIICCILACLCPRDEGYSRKRNRSSNNDCDCSCCIDCFKKLVRWSLSANRKNNDTVPYPRCSPGGSNSFDGGWNGGSTPQISSGFGGTVRR